MGFWCLIYRGVCADFPFRKILSWNFFHRKSGPKVTIFGSKTTFLGSPAWILPTIIRPAFVVRVYPSGNTKFASATAKKHPRFKGLENRGFWPQNSFLTHFGPIFRPLFSRKNSSKKVFMKIFFIKKNFAQKKFFHGKKDIKSDQNRTFLPKESAPYGLFTFCHFFRTIFPSMTEFARKFLASAQKIYVLRGLFQLFP